MFLMSTSTHLMKAFQNTEDLKKGSRPGKAEPPQALPHASNRSCVPGPTMSGIIIYHSSRAFFQQTIQKTTLYPLYF